MEVALLSVITFSWSTPSCQLSSLMPWLQASFPKAPLTPLINIGEPFSGHVKILAMEVTARSPRLS
jgi:hypothetical protein